MAHGEDRKKRKIGVLGRKKSRYVGKKDRKRGRNMIRREYEREGIRKKKKINNKRENITP